MRNGLLLALALVGCGDNLGDNSGWVIVGGNECVADSHCPIGKYCDDDRQCQDLKPEGAWCHEDWECERGRCAYYQRDGEETDYGSCSATCDHFQDCRNPSYCVSLSDDDSVCRLRCLDNSACPTGFECDLEMLFPICVPVFSTSLVDDFHACPEVIGSGSHSDTPSTGPQNDVAIR